MLMNRRSASFQNKFSSADHFYHFRKVLEDVKEALPISGLGISKQEKISIVKAMGNEYKGHWFKCPKGERYLCLHFKLVQLLFILLYPFIFISLWCPWSNTSRYYDKLHV